MAIFACALAASITHVLLAGCSRKNSEDGFLSNLDPIQFDNDMDHSLNGKKNNPDFLILLVNT